MSSDDFASLHDVYEGLEVGKKCQKTSYALQFLWRDLSSDFDVIGLYSGYSGDAFPPLNRYTQSACIHPVWILILLRSCSF